MEDAAAAADGKIVVQGRYELGRVLGHGNFGRVHAARDLRTGRAVAVKVLAKDKLARAGMAEQVKREIAAMRTVSPHPNIVALHEVLATRSKIYLALELVRGGELFAAVAARSGGGRVRDEGAARGYFRQLVAAVDFCHGRGVFHRDLKLENLLLDGNGSLKVADFGLAALARHARADGLLRTACGTPAYVAPEVLAGEGYDGASVDLWSCGVILYALLVGRLPFRHEENLVAMYRKMQRGEFLCPPPWVSPDARKLIGQLLDPDPATRITVARLVETPWYRKKPPWPVLPPPPLNLKVKEPAPPGPPTAATPDARRATSEEEEPEVMNAFHLISLSEGFNLSPLFDQGGGGGGGAIRFVTREAASSVVSRLESLATGRGMMRVTKSGARGVRLEAVARGRAAAWLAVAAEIFSVAPSVLLVDVRKDGGDTAEYRAFCSEELRPALRDIVWRAAGDDTPASGRRHLI